MPWKTMGSPVIVDANVLLCAVDEASAHHLAAAEWLTSALNGNTRVGLPWQTLGAFVRISTHPRVAVSPLSAAETQSWIESSAAAALRG
jgi:PIN domain protein family protein